MTRSLVVIFVGLVAVIVGLIRLLWDTPRLAPIDLNKAVLLAQCFTPRGEIAANASAVTVAPLRAKKSETADLSAMDPPLALEFRVAAAIPVELPDASMRAELWKPPSTPTPTRTITMPANKSLTIKKSTGEFDFLLANGAVEIRRTGAHSLLMTRDAVRFGPAEQASYDVRFPREVTVEGKIEGDKRQAMLPAGTRGELKLLEGGQALVPLQPLMVAPWLYETPITLMPVRAAGQKGLGDLAIEARQPGFQFNAPGLSLMACVFANNYWQRVGVPETRAREPGAATVSINIPAGTLPAWGRAIYADIELAVASADGQYMAYGAFRAVDRAWAAGFAFVLTGLLFAWLSQLRREQMVEFRQQQLKKEVYLKAEDAKKKAEKAEEGRARWFAGLFIGADGDPSLSLFQIFIWTVITFWGLAYVFLVTGSLLSLTTEMMWLLGIAGTGSVLARWISQRGPEGSVPPPSQTGEVKKFEFWQMLSTNGRFDLLKLQLFVFTLMIATYVVWRILDTGAFPALDPNTLLLLGVSQGVYIGGKLAGTTALSRAQTIKLDLDLREAERKQLVDEQATLTRQQADLKTAGKDLSSADQQRLAALPELIKAKDKEIFDRRADYEKAVKELGLKPA